MVTPEGAGRPPSKARSGGKGAVVAAAAVAAIGGLIGFSALTQPETEAVEDTSTTSTTVAELSRPIDLENFDVGQITQGQPLDWTRTATLDGGAYGQLVHHDGRLYLFTLEVVGSPFGRTAGSVRAWRQDAPGAWTDLGDMPPGTQPFTITSTELGLLAIAGAAPGQSPLLLRSQDGASWAAEELPSVSDSRFAATSGRSLAANSAITVVSLSADMDLSAAVAERYEEEFGQALDLDRFQAGPPSRSR